MSKREDAVQTILPLSPDAIRNSSTWHRRRGQGRDGSTGGKPGSAA